MNIIEMKEIISSKSGYLRNIENKINRNVDHSRVLFFDEIE